MAASTSRTLSDVYSFDTVNGVVKSVDEAQVEQCVVTDIRNAFGGEEVSTDTTTPLGRMIEWLSLYFHNSLSINVQNANQLVLRAAAGQQLDAIADWFQMERKSAMPTVVTATLDGVSGTTIPSGSRAQTVDGDIFVSASSVTLDSSGTATCQFYSEETGPISCPKNTLTTIDTPVVGWYSITNTSDGTLGREIETDDDLRLRIENGRAVGSGWLTAIKNAIEKVSGVRSSMVLENNSGAALDVHGVPMAPHSVFICVDGITSSSEAEIKKSLAEAVLDTMSSGTGYTRFDDKTNEIEIQYTDAFGNPYSVYAYAPENCNIRVDVKVILRSYSGTDYVEDVKTAIAEWAKENTFAIGEMVYASDVIKAVEDRVPGIIVTEAYVGENPLAGVLGSATQTYVEVPGNQKAVFKKEWIGVTPN